MRKILSVFGCRPDAIKMAPLIRAIRESEKLQSVVCVTAQHRDMLDQVLELFEIKPEYDLDIMKPNQDLTDITTNILLRLKPVLQAEKPDMVLVHGDSGTALAAGLAAFYQRIPIGHVEAGLRTGRIYSPYPEECNRQMVGAISTFHFAPTRQAAESLLAERFPAETIFTTGNTVVDALLWVTSKKQEFPHLAKLFGNRPMILMTVHRRENHGAPAAEIFRAVSDFARENPGFQIVYPVHPNPNVREMARAKLAGFPNISLIDPLGYEELAYMIKSCQFLMTDSGGIQEEAPTFGKPILVLRDTTERPEAVEAGCASLVGTNYDRISTMMRKLADTASPEYRSMSRAASPFGDGTSSRQIVAILEKAFDKPFPLRANPEQILN